LVIKKPKLSFTEIERRKRDVPQKRVGRTECEINIKHGRKAEEEGAQRKATTIEKSGGDRM
jgi:hypothetical protein